MIMPDSIPVSEFLPQNRRFRFISEAPLVER